MIGQYLSNTNENATVSVLKKNLKLNKALVMVHFYNNFVCTQVHLISCVWPGATVKGTKPMKHTTVQN